MKTYLLSILIISAPLAAASGLTSVGLPVDGNIEVASMQTVSSTFMLLAPRSMMRARCRNGCVLVMETIEARH